MERTFSMPKTLLGRRGVRQLDLVAAPLRDRMTQIWDLSIAAAHGQQGPSGFLNSHCIEESLTALVNSFNRLRFDARKKYFFKKYGKR
jgi:hypothetical protein